MAQAISIRIDFIDQKGKESHTKIRVPNGFTIADYVEFAEAVCQLVLNISTARITRASITFNVSLAGLGLKTVASSVSNVAVKLAMRFATAVSGFFAKTLIPSNDEGDEIAGSDNIDQSDTEVAALISAFEDGIAVTGGTVTFTNDREHDITAATEVKQQFRRRKSA